MRKSPSLSSHYSMKPVLIALTCFLMLCASVAQAGSNTLSVTEYHGGPDRSGHYVVPGLTWDRARNIHATAGFRGDIQGHVYAQPLYWHPSGSSRGLIIIATEDDAVYALDSKTGAVVWKRSLGDPVSSSSLSCGNIDPLGITGTPVIDAGLQAVYLDAFVRQSDGPQHLIFGLSLRDGSTLPGWPVNVSTAAERLGLHFNSRDQDQRGALTIAGGRMYVPYGGHFGDCGVYHGWIVGVSLQDTKNVVAWETRARGGGIWAPGGVSYADQSLFFATGNTMATWGWSDGEAVIRLGLDLESSAFREISSHHAIGGNSTITMPTSVALLLYCSARRAAGDQPRCCSRLARMARRICSIGRILAELAALWLLERFRVGQSALHRQPSVLATMRLSLFRVKASTARMAWRMPVLPC